ncbi:MAG: hexose kinase [Chloroflexi bacterium]|nr:hexose kinase [Chloroflexota bacterium]
MIVTVTPNTSMDLTYFVPSWELNRTLRASRILQSIGGKPTDASYILGELGIASLALGFVAGGAGETIKGFLTSKGVTLDLIQVDGSSRTNLIVVVEDAGGQTAITAESLITTEDHLETLRMKYIQALDQATCVVLGGTLPKTMRPDFYTEFVALARDRDIPVVLDAGEPNLSAGLKSRPNYAKPNQDELSAFAGRRIVTVEDAYHAGRMMIERYGTQPIITLGGEGGLAVLHDCAYRIPPLNVPVESAAGAGDAVLAGIAASLAARQPIEEGIRLGFAAATAVVIMPGTAECRKADVERFLPQIELIPYTPLTFGPYQDEDDDEL